MNIVSYFLTIIWSYSLFVVIFLPCWWLYLRVFLCAGSFFNKVFRYRYFLDFRLFVMTVFLCVAIWSLDHKAVINLTWLDLTVLFVVRYDIDYTFCFDTTRYCTLDYFLLSGALYETCIDSVTVVHDINNMSDHHPIFMHLSLDTEHVGVTNKAHILRPSWVKANVMDLDQYLDALS